VMEPSLPDFAGCRDGFFPADFTPRLVLPICFKMFSSCRLEIELDLTLF
jgi:hypothetical protein